MKRKRIISILLSFIFVVGFLGIPPKMKFVNAEEPEFTIRSITMDKESYLMPSFPVVIVDVSCSKGICAAQVEAYRIEGDTFNDTMNTGNYLDGFWQSDIDNNRIVYDGKIEMQLNGDGVTYNNPGLWQIVAVTLYIGDDIKYYQVGGPNARTLRNDISSDENFIRGNGKKFNNYIQNGQSTGGSVIVGDTLYYDDYYSLPEDGQPPKISLKAPQFTLKDDMDFYLSLYDNDSNLAEKIKKVPEGKTVGLGIGVKDSPWKEYEECMDGYSVGYTMPFASVGKDVFQAIKGKDVTLVIYHVADLYRWVFNGKDIINPKEINAWIEVCPVISPYGGDESKVDWEIFDWDKYVIQPEDVMGVSIKFAPNGELPGKAEIRLKNDILWKVGQGEYQKGKQLKLYYNKGGKYIEEKGAGCIVTDNGDDKWLSFTINHNSQFVASYGDLEGKSGSSVPQSEWRGGKWFNVDGSQTYSPMGSWNSDSSGWWYGDTSGWYAHDEWVRIDQQWYYFDSDGYMVTNEYRDGLWITSDGTVDYTYFLSWKSNSTGWWVEDKSSWWPSSQWLKIDGSWYYFTSDGYMDYGEYRDGCWLGSDGAMDPNSVNGAWHLDGKGWYYSDNGWYPKNQYLWIDGTSYWFDSSGYCN